MGGQDRTCGHLRVRPVRYLSGRSARLRGRMESRLGITSRHPSQRTRLTNQLTSRSSGSAERGAKQQRFLSGPLGSGRAVSAWPSRSRPLIPGTPTSPRYCLRRLMTAGSGCSLARNWRAGPLALWRRRRDRHGASAPTPFRYHPGVNRTLSSDRQQRARDTGVGKYQRGRTQRWQLRVGAADREGRDAPCVHAGCGS